MHLDVENGGIESDKCSSGEKFNKGFIFQENIWNKVNRKSLEKSTEENRKIDQEFYSLV